MNKTTEKIISKVIEECFIENPGAKAAKKLLALGVSREDFREFMGKTLSGRLTRSDIKIKIENAYCNIERGLKI